MKSKLNKISYSAASVFPAKLLGLKVISEDNKIMPIHIQLNPTNVCNFNCPFCSCANRDKSLILSLEDIVEIMIKAKKCGALAVTITGGGEPLSHPRINEIIALMKRLDIKVGIATNGSLLGNLDFDSLAYITWIRVSVSDKIQNQLLSNGLKLDDWFSIIKKTVLSAKNIDWAFSHVLSRNPNYELLQRIIDFSNDLNFTHIRIVSDLFDLDNVPEMGIVKSNLKNDRLVIYQGRKDHTKGTAKCFLSVLKPVVGADGKLYPCCGTQYALDKPGKDYEPTMCMGDAKDIDKIYSEQKFFNGSVCVKCYYSQYNNALGIISGKIKHREFV